MSLVAGTRLGPYEIQSAIGAGGMGEVYKARDTRLDRTVAIKILRAGATDSERRLRFEQEARAVSALDHPHICVLHDIGRQGETDYLVMEFLDGQTLAERLVGTPLPVSQVLEYGLQIASALDKAHRAGIIHRDLKPGNIMVTRSGVKLLDFGLAKLNTTPVAGTAAATTLATADGPVTEKGTVLGTVPYMSPEQVEGRAVDGRTDIFSLGTILYQMLTGKRPFDGPSSASVFAAILSSDPPSLTTARPDIPPGLDRLVRKCLAKDPDDRWQTAKDLGDEFKWLLSGSGSSGGVLARTEPPKPTRRRARWIAGATVVTILPFVIAAFMFTRWSGSRASRERPSVRYTQITTSGDLFDASLSPDGRTVAFVVPPDRLMIRDLGGRREVEIARGRFNVPLRWMPDGSEIVVRESKNLETGASDWVAVPRLGGPPRWMAPGSPLLALSPDGTEIVTGFLLSRELTVFRNGNGRPSIPLPPGVRWNLALDWSTVSKRLALTGIADDQTAGAWTFGPDGKSSRRVYTGTELGEQLFPCWSRTADVLYLLRTRNATTDLLRVDLSVATATTEVLASGLPPSWRCESSNDGTRLLQFRAIRVSNLWRVGLDSRGSKPVAMTSSTIPVELPAVTPDGRSILATRGTEVVRLSIDGGDATVVVNGLAAVPSPDGTHLAFVTYQNGKKRVWVGDANGQHPREIEGADVSNPNITWFPDGRLAWQTVDSRNYRIRDLQTGRDEPLVEEEASQFVFYPVVSPRGDRVVLFWNRTERGLWLLSWPGRAASRRLASVAAGKPFGWSPDGKWVFASSGNSILRVNADAGDTTTVAAFAVGGISNCTMTPDGRTAVCAVFDDKRDAWIAENFDPHVETRR